MPATRLRWWACSAAATGLHNAGLLVSGLLITGLALSSCQEKSAATPVEPLAVLQANLGKDLRKLGPRAAADLRAALTKVTLAFEPWCLQPYKNGRTRYVAVELRNRIDLVGGRLHAFDESWKWTGMHEFMAGVSTVIEAVEVRNESPLKVPVVVVQTRSAGPFKPGTNQPLYDTMGSQWQYYVVRDDDLVLVRIEDLNHTALGPNYTTRVPYKGTAVPQRTAAQWQAMLSAPSDVDVLAALLWLSGRHLSSKEDRVPAANPEPVATSKLFEAVYGNDEVQERLRLLSKNDNAWVSEYAKLALVAPKDR